MFTVAICHAFDMVTAALIYSFWSLIHFGCLFVSVIYSLMSFIHLVVKAFILHLYKTSIYLERVARPRQKCMLLKTSVNSVVVSKTS